MADPCTCGHSADDHRESEESLHGGPCTVCVCNRFDWDLDAVPADPKPPSPPEPRPHEPIWTTTSCPHCGGEVDGIRVLTEAEIGRAASPGDAEEATPDPLREWVREERVRHDARKAGGMETGDFYPRVVPSVLKELERLAASPVSAAEATLRERVEAVLRKWENSTMTPDGALWFGIVDREIRSALSGDRTADPVVRSDWKCEAGTEACPGTQGSLKKDWLCDACGRRAHAPKTWRDKGLASKPKTYEPSALPSGGSSTGGPDDAGKEPRDG